MKGFEQQVLGTSACPGDTGSHGAAGNPDEIHITGSKAVFARVAAEGVKADAADAAPGVLTFVRKWRARQDSNLRPQA